MSESGWNDVDDIVLHLKIIALTALVGLVVVTVLATYESATPEPRRNNGPLVSQVQFQARQEYKRDAFFLKCEE